VEGKERVGEKGKVVRLRGERERLRDWVSVQRAWVALGNIMWREHDEIAA
jgi:hypothetical protein